MPLLFSYGTLQQEDVQWSTFGRLLEGQRDELPGFEPSVSATQQHANVIFTGRADSRVAGTVFEITDAELAAADEYEQRAKYTRIAATLASGKQGWVYVDGSIVLRHAVLADVPAIAGLVTQLGYPTSAADMDARLQRLLALPHHTVVVAEGSGRIAGMAGGCVEYAFDLNAPYGRVTALVVDERWRRLGIGRLLMRRVEQWCAEHGAERVTLTSGNHRPESHKFYKSIGYEATGLRFIKKL
jgi:GNAT superfamily N-acetyltransferase